MADEKNAGEHDHRRLGRELDLFVFSDLVGPGLPLWTPRGALVRKLLDDYVWELRKKRGYQKVEIPHITKKELYETSGHWDKFQDDLFRIKTREDKEFALKPMNCPHHIQIFARRPHSYREMPQRFAETTMMYRDEQSGELNGLSRVRAITIDDAHVFCRESQVKEEFAKIWDIIQEFYGTFGFALTMRLSFHDPAKPENYLGDTSRWKFAEDTLRAIAAEKKAGTSEGVGEAAFYGPKIDFMAKDSLGREWQVATIQLDLNMPERFDLSCINEKGEKERIVMVHAAIMGSIERFLSVILEHLDGKLPLWLSPVQLTVLPVSEKHAAYAHQIASALTEEDIRAEVDDSSDTLGKRIRASKTMKIPYLLVVGDEEVAAKTATLEGRTGKLGAFPISEIVSKLNEEIEKRS